MVGRKLVSQEASQKQENREVMQVFCNKIHIHLQNVLTKIIAPCYAGEGYDYDSDVASLMEQGEVRAEERTNFG